jgi:3-hydroxyisobutyrate dehydrogenase
MRLGVLGLGRMGRAIAARLLERGHTVWVWNRTAEKAAPLQEAGAKRAETPAQLAMEVEAMLSILFDAAALDNVYRGPNGVLNGPLVGKLVIEMSTVRPMVSKALAADVAKAGGSFVECPVSGTTGPARNGTLLGLAGGEAADVARALPILQELCRRVEHMGPVGAGAAMKLAVNLPLLVFYQAFSEANALVHHLGGDPGRLVGIFADTSGGANVLRVRGEKIASALKGHSAGPVNFSVSAACKDLEIMLEEAAALGFDLPLVRTTLGVFNRAKTQGWGERDSSELTGYWLHHGQG